MRTRITKDLLEKFVSGFCSEDERAAVQRWINDKDYDEINLPSEYEIVIVGSRLWRSIFIDIRRKKTVTIAVISAAASIIAIIMIGLWWQSREPATNYIIYQTGFSERKDLLLEDGTAVSMNANSRLLLPTDFGKKKRLIRFSGEAYFSVARDTVNPFTIETDSSLIKVLGTKFNFSAYPRSSQKLTVTEGRVAFSSINSDISKGIVVSKDQYATLSHRKIRFRKEHNPMMSTSWMTDQFYADNVSFEEISEKIFNTHGAKVEFVNEDLKAVRFKGKFEDTSPAVLLRELQLVQNFSFSIHDNTIIIRRKI